MDELTRTMGDMPMLASDRVIDLARQAEARIEAIKKIKQMALAVTNADDWVDENGKPYLQASGAWRIDEPVVEDEPSGHYTYTFKGYFSLAGRDIEVQGSRSSKDPFFKKYDWKPVLDAEGKRTYDPEGKQINEKVDKPIGDIDRRDVKMAALTNLIGNGITRILGIRNLTWADLDAFAHVKQSDVRGVKYKDKSGNKPPLQEPQKKANGESKPESTGNLVCHTTVTKHRESKNAGRQRAILQYVLEIRL
jgi:hypothetical protein